MAAAILARRDFIALVRKRAPVPVGARLVKQGEISAVQEVRPRVLRFVASTEAVDREGDVIRLAGWDLAAFRRNPSIFYNHFTDDHPIGKAVEIGVSAGALRMTVEFVPADIPEAGPRAEAVYRMLRGGFLSACSVGFRPVRWTIPQGEDARGDDRLPGVTFDQVELAEVSVVGVPCNTEALLEPGQAVAAGDQRAARRLSPEERRRRLRLVLALAG